jgi:hypothetical protein
LIEHQNAIVNLQGGELNTHGDVPRILLTAANQGKKKKRELSKHGKNLHITTGVNSRKSL